MKLKIRISWWDYNNNNFRIDSGSVYHSMDIIGENAADVMEQIENIRFFHNVAVRSPIQIETLEDI